MVTSKGHQTLVMNGEFIEGFHMITLKHVTIVTPPYSCEQSYVQFHNLHQEQMDVDIVRWVQIS